MKQKSTLLLLLILIFYATHSSCNGYQAPQIVLGYGASGNNSSPYNNPGSYHEQHSSIPWKSAAFQVMNSVVPGVVQAYAAYVGIKSLINYFSSTNGTSTPQAQPPDLHRYHETVLPCSQAPPSHILPAQNIITVPSLPQELEQLATEYRYELHDAMAWQHHEQHLAQRLKALEALRRAPEHTQQTYELNTDTLALITTCNFDKTNYTSCTGNQLQRVLHQEVIDIMTKTARLCHDNNKAVHQFELVNLLIDFTDLGCAYNKSTYTMKTITILDTCWVLLDGLQATVEGFAHGVWNTAKACMHPIQLAQDMVTGYITMAHCIGRVAVEVGNIGITCVANPEQAHNALVAHYTNLHVMWSAIEQKFRTIPTHDLIKAGVEVATEFFLMGKCLSALGRFYQQAQKHTTSLLKFRKKWHQVAATPEGFTIQTASKATEFISKATQAGGEYGNALVQKIAQVPASIPKMLNLAERVPYLQKMFDGTKVYIKDIGEMVLTIDYEHIFGLAIKQKFKRGILSNQFINGFHHDFMGHLEQAGLIVLDVIKTGIEGAVDAYVKVDGVLFRNKTFFPKHWTHETVVKKILESLTHLYKEPVLQDNGNWQIIGSTLENLKIETIINQSGKIITAYPYLGN
jgi:EndoU nuclease-like protein